MSGHVSEWRGKPGFDCPRMQPEDNGGGIAETHFMGKIDDHHIETGLGRTVAMPAATAVITDAANTGGKQGHHGFALTRQQRQKMSANKRRPMQLAR